jgi:hypothetical protein
MHTAHVVVASERSWCRVVGKGSKRIIILGAGQLLSFHLQLMSAAVVAAIDGDALSAPGPWQGKAERHY